MSTSKTTILVPSIGRMEFLPETRRCVEAQTRSDFKVLILDNASPEPAKSFFTRWAEDDDRVEVLRADPRVPMFTNFNRGMRAVTTEFVTFFHDDDVYRPRYLELLVGLLESNPGAAFSGSNYDFVDEDGGITEERRWIKKTEHWSPARYTKELIGRGRNPVAMSGLVFRRSSFGPDGFDESLPIHFGDFVLLMRAAEEGGVVVAQDSVLAIRRHAGQASAAPLSRMVPLRTELMLAYLDEFVARHPSEQALVAELRSRVDFSHRAAMVWGWMNAEERAERDACLQELGERRRDHALRSVLHWIDDRGFRPPSLGARLGRVARAAAATMKI